MALTTVAAEVYRDYDLDGVPASGAHNPKKLDIRRLLSGYENVINAFTSAGGLIYDTRALLESDLAKTANSMAWVISDASAANNGVYKKVGASGTGSWARVADLPYSFIVAEDSGAGMANAIQATSSLPVSGSALILLNIYETNGPGPTTVQFNGGTVYTVKTNGGNDVAPGGLQSGMLVMGRVSGATFRLVSDQASAALLAQMEELFGDFQQHYAGSFPDNTAADAALGTPTEGAIYWNSTENNLLVYDGATWQPIETVLLSSLAQAEAGTDNLTAITPLRLTQKLKHDGFLSATQFGIQLDGGTDQSTQLLTALQEIAAVGGGWVQVPGGRKIYLSNSVSMPAFTAIKTGRSRVGGLTSDLSDLLEKNAGLRLVPGATIRVNSGCELQGLLVLNPAITGQQTRAQADAWVGTAIEVGASTSDHWLSDLTIIGYDRPVDREQVGEVGIARFNMFSCLIDCNQGPRVEYDYDVPRLRDIQLYPLTAQGSEVLADYKRSGLGFQIGKACDWGFMDNCFDLGHAVSFDVNGPRNFSIINSGADGQAPGGNDNTIGFRVRGDATNVTLSVIRSAAKHHGLLIEQSETTLNSDNNVIEAVLVNGLNTFACLSGVTQISGRSKIRDLRAHTGQAGGIGVQALSGVMELLDASIGDCATGISRSGSARIIERGHTRFRGVTTLRSSPYVQSLTAVNNPLLDGELPIYTFNNTTGANINISTMQGSRNYENQIVTITIEGNSTVTFQDSNEQPADSNTINIASGSRVVPVGGTVQFLARNGNWREIAFAGN